ncbi:MULTISPECIES: hypothetical protein [unclassified Polaromonas]|uniref:hypothetical protein n=1 Tax=unclassified Polaromonas TaxID=2638319 RepID=UPI000F0734DA|nr:MULTISPECIES: hypothetical protein [unclassified Polaromonas]AYQ29636.1 hypothetical protein DT070_17425 [Polaromonas sp. SP1]QGJ19249.1 hypothetical protein F7R28_13160 [Polaromonas sp. Pch-P]
MKHPSPLPGIKARSAAYEAMKSLGFVNLNRLFESRSRQSGAPVQAGSGEAEAEALQGRSGAQPLLRALRGDPPDPRLIQAEDWDMMFRAIQARLVTAVGDRPDSARAPAAGDAAGHTQVTVLECVHAMGQLHAALKLQRP